MLFKTWAPLTHVYACAPGLVEHLLAVYGLVQGQPSVLYRALFLLTIEYAHGFSDHQVLLFLFSEGVVEHHLHGVILNGDSTAGLRHLKLRSRSFVFLIYAVVKLNDAFMRRLW